MRVMSIIPNDATNSITGFTYSIFFSGCDHHCEGCFSQQTWDYHAGSLVTAEDLFKEIKKSPHKNVSLIGGDPLFRFNREGVFRLIKMIKSINKNVYLWTGYSAEEVVLFLNKFKDNALSIREIDYLIEGKFELDKKDLRLTLRGSSNQKIYHKGEYVDLDLK